MSKESGFAYDQILTINAVWERVRLLMVFENYAWHLKKSPYFNFLCHSVVAPFSIPWKVLLALVHLNTSLARGGGGGREEGTVMGPFLSSHSPHLFYGEGEWEYPCVALRNTTFCQNILSKALGCCKEIAAAFSMHGTEQRDDAFCFIIFIVGCHAPRIFHIWAGPFSWVVIVTVMSFIEEQVGGTSKGDTLSSHPESVL